MDTDESTDKILTFMEKNFKDLYSKIPQQFSEKSINALSLIVRLLIEGKQKYNRTHINYDDIPSVFHLQNSQLYQYIPGNIQKKITKMGYPYKISFKINQRDINVYFFNTDHIPSQYKEYIERIYIWLYVAYKFSMGGCSQKLDIFIYLTDETKLLPRPTKTKNNIIIDEMNANTGLTTSCKPQNEIHVYRKEEWFKVFIHETFHNLGMDFSNMDIQFACAKLFSHFPVKTNILFYETYCEVWAELIYALFISLMNHRETDPLKIINQSRRYIMHMQLFSIIQCVKVLRHNNLHYTDLYDLNKTLKRKHYTENTEVLSYYVFKSVLLFHINDFIEWCSLYNGKKIMQFTKTHMNISHYCDLIIFTYKFHNDTYIAIYDTINEWFEKNRHPNKYEHITLRMTPF